MTKTPGFNRNHPERREGEVFLANCYESPIDETFPDPDQEEDYEYIGWKTKRKGNIAYGSNTGNPLQEGYFPVFVQQSEIAGVYPEILKELLSEEN